MEGSCIIIRNDKVMPSVKFSSPVGYPSGSHKEGLPSFIAFNSDSSIDNVRAEKLNKEYILLSGESRRFEAMLFAVTCH